MDKEKTIRRIQDDAEEKVKEIDREVARAEKAKEKLPRAESGTLLEQKPQDEEGRATTAPSDAPSPATPPDRSSTSP